MCFERLDLDFFFFFLPDDLDFTDLTDFVGDGGSWRVEGGFGAAGECLGPDLGAAFAGGGDAADGPGDKVGLVDVVSACATD